MPDLMNLTITDLPDVTATVPRFQVSVEVHHSQTGAMLNDFSGPNAWNFPGVLLSLTSQQRKSLLRGLIHRIILMKIGADDGSRSDF